MTALTNLTSEADQYINVVSNAEPNEDVYNLEDMRDAYIKGRLNSELPDEVAKMAAYMAKENPIEKAHDPVAWVEALYRQISDMLLDDDINVEE